MSDSEARERWEPRSTEELFSTPSVDSHLGDGSEYSSRLLIDSMVEGFAVHEIILDDEGRPCDYRFLDVNAAFESLTGLKTGEVIGRTVMEILPGTEPLWIERFGAVATTGVPARFEDYSVEFDRYFRIVAYSPRRGQFAVLFSDVTSRRRSEETLRRMAQLLHRTQEMANLGSWELDLKLNKLTWSDETYRILGVPRGQDSVNYETFLEAVHPDDRDAVNAAYIGSIEANADHYEIEHRVVHQGTREVRIVHERCDHERDASGEIVRSVGMVSDISERKQAEMILNRFYENLEILVEERTEEASRASRAKSEFLASMSHELRTPLNSIIGFSKVMLDGMAGGVNEEQQRQLRMIHRSGTLLLALVDDILDLSKIEARAVSIELGKTNISRICSDAVEQMRPVAETKGIELQFATCTEECSHRGMVMTDQRKVTQIVLNLLSNAVKFTKDGSVKCEIDCAGEKTILIRVIDTGVGIESDALERIFREFEQIPMDDEAKPQGTGLGLFISRRLASLLGGELTVTSTPGFGSEFTLHLPLQFADDSHE